MSDERTEFLGAVHDPILNTIIWNAPDHEHTRYQLRAWLEEAIVEAYAIYELQGGDLANVASHLLSDKDKAAAHRRQSELEAESGI